jgi:hypothetical protein
MPVRVIVVNDSGREIIVYLFEHKRTIPAGSSSEFPFGQFFENAKIQSGNVAYGYSMPLLPPRKLMLREKYPEKFALSFEADGALRLLKLLPSGATESLAKQPAGYPLKPR